MGFVEAVLRPRRAEGGFKPPDTSLHSVPLALLFRHRLNMCVRTNPHGYIYTYVLFSVHRRQRIFRASRHNFWDASLRSLVPFCLTVLFFVTRRLGFCAGILASLTRIGREFVANFESARLTTNKEVVQGELLLEG